MINVEIIKVHAGQILPCGRVTGNKEFTIGGLSATVDSPRTHLFDARMIIPGWAVILACFGVKWV